jgi:putative spermidine/putrescine transport system ATP-binding protein
VAEVATQGVSKAYGTVWAVRDVSLTVAEGRFVALMGPSGCGKTTLLRLIAGLERSDAGTIRIGARDVTALPPERRDVGLMFQSYALFPHMTVAENLAFPMRMRRGYDGAERGRRVARALDLVRLVNVGDRYPRQLSGGQQQRVAFARALIDEPSVLLLDEPLSNLDARLRDEMQFELVELRRQVPITTVLVTHDQIEGLTLADEIVVMREGRVEQAGPPQRVYSDPATPFVADFLGGANLIPVEVLKAADGGWQARAADGTTVPAPPPRNGQVGPATLMLRQEHLRLVRPGECADANVSGCVGAVAYRGPAVQVVIEAMGKRLRLIAPPDTRLDPGASVAIGWSLIDARLIR